MRKMVIFAFLFCISCGGGSVSNDYDPKGLEPLPDNRCAVMFQTVTQDQYERGTTPQGADVHSLCTTVVPLGEIDAAITAKAAQIVRDYPKLGGPVPPNKWMVAVFAASRWCQSDAFVQHSMINTFGIEDFVGPATTTPDDVADSWDKDYRPGHFTVCAAGAFFQYGNTGQLVMAVVANTPETRLKDQPIMARVIGYEYEHAYSSASGINHAHPLFPDLRGSEK